MELANYVRTEMSKTANLITDMTLKGASTEELSRAKETMTDEEAEVFLDKVNELEWTVMSEREIADTLGLTVIDYRRKRWLATKLRRNKVKSLYAEGLSFTEIAERMGYGADNEDYIRRLLKMDAPERPHLPITKLVKVLD